MSVAQIENDLGYGQFEAELRGQHGLWRTLQQLRTKAVSDATVCPQYRIILARSIDRLKQHRADVMSDEEQEAASKEFLRWHAQLLADRNIPDRESRRGSYFEPWCAKWIPESWGRYMRAMTLLFDSPTRTNLELLKTETVALVDAYLDDFPK